MKKQVKIIIFVVILLVIVIGIVTIVNNNNNKERKVNDYCNKYGLYGNCDFHMSDLSPVVYDL